ncbi:type I DNA topoisomerase [Soehngenia saccharolytica]|nr:type I DNA topoisomerase [Soehngenia saccharolytica]
MTKNLVIVESPAKAKSISKMLGKNYTVIASLGHIRDLPKSRLGIDIKNNFEPEYITIRGKGTIVGNLKKEAKKSDNVFLATDPDREGEAISWHLASLLDIDKNTPCRVEFHEITKDTVKNSIKSPRKLDENLYNAQQARRVLDRLVGYKISPILWKKVKKGLSAGRVQSVAVKLICDRENEINEFIPEEYWTIKGFFRKENDKFEAMLSHQIVNDKEIKLKIRNEDEAKNILREIKNNENIIYDIKKTKRKRSPYPPYTTSTLQQDASKKLGYTSKKTMMIAQQLYEGIDVKGEGTTGLITYMRTDSTRISAEAVEAAKDFILQNYGKEYSNGGNTYSKKAKKETQDAHEGIRPAHLNLWPDKIKDSLTKEQYKLYKLIWDRFIGSQMSDAIYDTVSVKIKNGEYIFKCNGSKLHFSGFLKVYTTADEEQNDIVLPELSVGEKLDLIKVEEKRNFTQPPSRYTEASLIKTMEDLGIGRPSTYSPTISTILSRGYVTLDKKTFYPTELGTIVNDILISYFSEIINEEFTAQLENQLDEIAEGKLNWQDVIKEFYLKFENALEKAESEIEKIELKYEESDEICEKCGRKMVIKIGKYGKFLACPGYPECKNAKPILEKIGVKCPLCEDGEIVKKRTKKGRLFYGCSNYPNCEFNSWQEPVQEKCPKCGSMMVIKQTKKSKSIICTNDKCGYNKNI